MSYGEALKNLAPCGLNCIKCLNFREGDIRRHASELKELLGSFDRYAERFSAFKPVFKNYPAFRELLDHFARAGCGGCRQGDCKYFDCGVSACYGQKGVDFCFQCDDFPCEKTNFDPDLKERWLKMNSRMKEIGVEAYLAETRDMPRYA